MLSNSKKDKPDLAALKIDPELKEQKNNKKPLLWFIGSIFLIVAIIVLGVLFKDRSVEVKTLTVLRQQRGKGLTVLNASGYVVARRKATVASKLTGQVIEVLVEEGMKVDKGQVLARLDDSDAKASFTASDADLKVAMAKISEFEISLDDAERDLSRIRELFSKKIVSQEDLDKSKVSVNKYKSQLSRARTEVQAAVARVQMARQVLENCTIRSPFTGIVVSKDAQIGEMVSPVSAGGGYTRTGIATIVDMDSLEIEVDVNESYIANVSPSQKVIATLDAYPEWEIPASVLALIPTADRQKATVRVRIAFEELDPRILPDMGVKVAFMTEPTFSQSSKSVLIVSKSAVRERDKKSIVFVFHGGFVERRAVKIGKALGDTVEILAGLTEGEQVVIDGPDNLKDGQKAVNKM